MRRLIVLSLIVVLAMSGVPASAHRQFVESAPNPDAGRLDVESIEVRHPRGLIQFEITFREPHRLREEDGSVTLFFNPKTRFRRSVGLNRNPDGSFFGSISGRASSIIGFARVWIPEGNDRALMFQLHRRQLKRFGPAPRMNWAIVTRYFDPECPIQGDIADVCSDRVPETGVVRHPFP
jgi:hypothetical protein